MKRGRPKVEEPMSERLYIRVKPTRKKEIQEFAEKRGYSLLELLEKGIEVAENERVDKRI